MIAADYSPVLRRFERVRPLPGSNRWQALCPVHGDRRPSLALWVGSSGCLCAKCMSNKGCSFRQIVHAVGTEERDWFPPKEKERRRRMPDEPKPKCVAAYEYRDENGKLLYEIRRWEPGLRGGRKDFAVWGEDGHGGMANGLCPTTPKVLYRLPELLARPKQPVFVVEGEAKVIALMALGFVATCNPFGAGKWLHEYSKWLKGRRCVVLPDNDPPGWAHALSVAGSLLVGAAESIRVVSLPGLPERGDVVDWLRDSFPGATDKQKRDSLISYAKAAPEWRASLPVPEVKAA